MTCPSCGGAIPAGANFCPLCGARLGRACPNCGTPAEPSHAFCLNCGASLQTGEPATARTPPAPAPLPTRAGSAATSVVAERRLVSILFVDLVGFTTLSERRDAEEVRELLTRYFDTARIVITRYGGTVEKFIGDAVMALWGAPTAHENDAELCVRTALELISAVAALGAEVGHDDLRARAGVVTGEVAVTVGAVGQGLVAGDAVNTASRIQSAAQPGEVLVDDSTRRASELAITYDSAGSHELKGKAEPVVLWRAQRVVGGRGGAQRTVGLEGPFVGRDRELRLAKDLFHATDEERRGRLVSITGIAGIGKSRLSWEFEKYADGLADTVYWHRGRCLSYGEGVTYWALAEMVRRRADIVEAEASTSATQKLRACLAEHVRDAEEREWLEPRLATLLGLEEGGPSDRVDLFAAWRVFFERLAEKQSTVLVFEEMQWADSSLVEFIEYLMDWSRHLPLFVMTLARPEFTERFPTWGAGKRSFHAMHLEPLAPSAMDDLLTGLVPGLPAGLRAQIRERAEGIPLYAVETVRMLLDRGTLQREGNRYVLTGAVGDLAVPETLQALIAARLDALTPSEREVMQTAAILGHTFNPERLAALIGRGESETRELLDGLVQKELLSLQVDPRSPERGQYGFLQALVQRVAYETLSRHERKKRHLEAARQLESTWGGETDEIVEVVAAHYLDAYRAGPNDDDADDIRRSGVRMLMRAGERAASLGAADEAQRHFTNAAELVEDDGERAGLIARAGDMAVDAGRNEKALELWEEARGLHSASGDVQGTARVTARIGGVMFLLGQPREALERMNASYAVLREAGDSVELGSLAQQMARMQYFLGETDKAAELIDIALDIAEGLRQQDLVCDALTTKAIVVGDRGHHNEAQALLRHGVAVALENQFYAIALRAQFNLLGELTLSDRVSVALAVGDEGVELARRRGQRQWEWTIQAGRMDLLHTVGRWDDALATGRELPDIREQRSNVIVGLLLTQVYIHIARGDLSSADAVLDAAVWLKDSDDLQSRTGYASAEAAVLLARGDQRSALHAGRIVIEHFLNDSTSVSEALHAATVAALALGDAESLRWMLEKSDAQGSARKSRRVSAHIDTARAALALVEGDAESADAAYASAERTLTALECAPDLARCRLIWAESLAARGAAAEAEALLDQADPELERLGATTWIRSAGAVRARIAAPSAVQAPA
ncbi:MAG: AAA family ATPase [Candidatus Dormibacteraeota bacterium]|nr:AAA family ATPase [Candidatus Dormibacteraeota bacterium]MBV9526162.1 AAA family ATPase [Candidatus Dormibacteraeota bacterium]